MQLSPLSGFARLIPIAIAALGLSASSTFAANNVTVGLNGKSFGTGTKLHAESTNVIDPSKAYTYSLQGTLVTDPAGTFGPLNGMTLAAVLELLEKGSSSKLVDQVKRNDPGTLPLAHLSNHVYKGTVSGIISVSLTISSQITAEGKVVIDVKNISIASPAGPIKDKIRLGPNSKLVVKTAPEIRFNLLKQNVDEKEGTVLVKVVRWGYVNSAASASFSTVPTMPNDTAIPGIDYDSTTVTVSFAPGETQKTIPIPIHINPAATSKVFFAVHLTNPSKGAAIGPIPDTIVNIIDRF